MRLVDKTVPFDSQKMFKGKYKKYDVTVYYSRNEASYWYFTLKKMRIVDLILYGKI